MKKLALFIPFLLAAFFIHAQNTIIHDANAEVRNVSGFHAIEVATGIDLIIKQGSSEAVAVSAVTPEIRNRIKTVVTNGKLKIYFDNAGWKDSKTKKELKAYVSFKDLDALEGNSGAAITTDGNISIDKLDVGLSSGANFDGDIKATSLTIDQSSGSQMHIKGNVSALKVSASSGSGFNGYDLMSENCNADASSGSEINITVIKTLNADASSGGSINYKGSGAVTNASNSSGGRIKKQG